VKTLPRPAVVATLSVLLCSWTPIPARAVEPDLESPYGVQRQWKDLRREINLHNLFNGLNLTNDQATRLVALAREAQSLRSSTFDAANERTGQVLDTYRRILDVVRAGRPLPGSLQAMGGLMELEEKRLHKTWLQAMAALEARVVRVLTPAQRKILNDFDPCLIPPDNLTSPVAVGQVKDTRGAKEVLEAVRALPEAGFDAACRRRLAVHVAMLEKFLGPMDPTRRDDELARMVAVCRQARRLDDVEYALQLDDLADRLNLDAQKDRFKAKAEEFMALVEQVQGGLIGTVAKHFLDPLVIPVLEGHLTRPPVTVPPAAAAGTTAAEPEKKYRVAELTEHLGLRGSTAETFRRTLAAAKLDHLTILQTRLADGTTVLQHFIAIQSLPAADRAAAFQQAVRAMQEPLPGRDASAHELILRLQLRLDEELRPILSADQYARFTALCRNPLDQVELDDGVKPAAKDVMTRLGLDDDQRRRFTDTVRSGQAEAFKLLSTPANDGVQPISLIVAAQSAPPAGRQAALQRFVDALHGTIPGRPVTYAEDLARIKADVDRNLARSLPRRTYQALTAMQPHILDVQFDDE